MALPHDLEVLPAQPGVYLMKDAAGTVLYVGKASSLRARVRSYFQPGADHSLRIQMMVARVREVDFKVTGSEIEALVLEANLVREHQPRYNVRLRDDKRFPWLKLTREPLPQLVECRDLAQDGARYFGPYVDAGAMRATDRLLRRLFKIRSCSFALSGQPQMRPCLDYHIGLCEAPCAGYVGIAEYNRQVDQAAAFLRGEVGDIVSELQAEMQAAAEHLEFEQAARLRDLIADLQKALAGQRIVSASGLEADVFAAAQHDDLSCVQLFFVRAGKVVGDHRGIFEGAADDTAGEAIRAFLTAYYGERPDIPRLVLLAAPLEDRAAIAQWLTQQRGQKVEVLVPERGERRQLVELVRDNAADSLRRWLTDRDQQRQRGEVAATDLRDHLGLPRTPFRIECYDIATLQGDWSVGSMVVLEDGRPVKKAYRQFKIRHPHAAPNDYEMMKEVLLRRLQRAIEGDPKFLPLPDLLLVDGGKGQLGVAVEVCETLGLQQLPLAALAKRQEHLFRPGQSDPIVLEARAPALRVLRALRDEAHRFANTFHQRLRRQSGLRSILDDIPGVGATRRTTLLSHFRSTQAIREASLDEIAALPGLNRPLAERVKRYLLQDHSGDQDEGYRDDPAGDA
ncbi:MAG: excinuclease ABC subunit UvrC [Fimbriimonadaceae bacterium]|nr:excinuclease ABC subunit UvrC [Fimbriimonadaceae bacterium]